MLQQTARGMAWIRSPKMMNGLRQTRRSVMEAGERLADKVVPARRRARRRRTAITRGVMAAAVSLPIGLWAGHRVLAARENGRLGLH